jgi:GT2 family glycosyltransferase
MKGIVGIVAAESSRYTSFWGDIQNLEAPEGVEVKIEYGGTLGMARNALVVQFLQTDAQWLVMIDDDHAIDPQFLRRWLYKHETKINEPLNHPIMASLYLLRGAPFAPTLYGVGDPSSLEHRYDHFSLYDFPTSGVVDRTRDGRSICAAGASGMFVRRDVYEKIPPPWYRLDEIGEDFYFCEKVQKVGFPICVDLDSRLGHIVPFTVWPDVLNDEWVTSIRRGSTRIVIDAAESKLPEGII